MDRRRCLIGGSALAWLSIGSPAWQAVRARSLVDVPDTSAQYVRLRDHGIDVNDPHSDQSDRLQRFFASLAPGQARIGVLEAGMAVGQNIEIPAGAHCINQGFVLICPDDPARRADLGYGIRAVAGYFSVGGAAPLRLEGLWSVRSKSGEADRSNGTVGFWCANAAEGSSLGDWTFQGIPAGVFLACARGARIGRTHGVNMRGFQFASRSGTGGTVLNFSGCEQTRAGFVSGVEVYKPALYFSPPMAGRNRGCRVDGVHALCALGGNEAHAVALRDAEDCSFGEIVGVGGTLCLNLSRHEYEAGTANAVKNVRFERVVCERQWSPTSSLVAGVTMDSYTGELPTGDGIDTTNVRIDRLELRDGAQYGVFRRNGELEIGELVVHSHPSATRPVIFHTRADRNGATTIGTVEIRQAASLPMSVNGRGRLRIGRMSASDAPMRGQLLFEVGSADASIEVDRLSLPSASESRWHGYERTVDRFSPTSSRVRIEGQPAAGWELSRGTGPS